MSPPRACSPRKTFVQRVLPDNLDAVRRFPGKRPLIIEIVNDDGLSFEFRASEGLAVGDESGLQSAVMEFAATQNAAG